MNAIRRILLWLAFAFACFLPAAALTPSAPENRIWEIFSTGYDATTTEVTDLESRNETSTSNYDTAPIHRAATEELPTEANRTLFGQNAEFMRVKGDRHLLGLTLIESQPAEIEIRQANSHYSPRLSC